MPSPFPGMDPYLEQFWRDIHARLVIYAADQLQACLPPDLRARVEERVFIEPAFGAPRSVYPDIRVVERGQGRAAAATISDTLDGPLGPQGPSRGPMPRRPGTPREVANCILFLVSDASLFVTGACLFVDGGQSAM